MANRVIRLLHVDDEEAEFILLRELLSAAQGIELEFQWAPDTESATQAINTTNFDVCLVDYFVGMDNGLDFIRKAIERGVATPFILMSGQRDPAVDREAIKIGVRQCINKDDTTTSTLLKAIQSAIGG